MGQPFAAPSLALGPQVDAGEQLREPERGGPHREAGEVVDELHYNTTFVLYRHLERTEGVELRIVKARDGGVAAADFAPLVDRRTRLVSVAWVSHQNGFRHDMPPLAELAHRHGAWLYADAVQAVGMFPIDVKQSGVDAVIIGNAA